MEEFFVELADGCEISKVGTEDFSFSFLRTKGQFQYKRTLKRKEQWWCSLIISETGHLGAWGQLVWHDMNLSQKIINEYISKSIDK